MWAVSGSGWASATCSPGRRRHAGVERRADRARPLAAVATQDVPPEQALGEHPLDPERLAAAEQAPQRPRLEPERSPACVAIGAREARERRALRAGSPPESARAAPGRGPRGARSRGSRRRARRRTATASSASPSRSRSAAAAADPGVRGGVAERGAAVLDVVVERPVDVGDVAERHRDQAEPVVVVLLARDLGERAAPARRPRAASARRRPVIVLAISSESRFVWLLRLLVQ